MPLDSPFRLAAAVAGLSVKKTTLKKTVGFTLVELLTVIAIIGAVAAIMIPTVVHIRKTAQQAAGRGNLRQIMSAVLIYASENRGVPPGPAARAQYAVLRKNDNSQLSWLLRDQLGVPAKALDNTVLPTVIPPLLQAKHDPASTAAYFAVNNIYLSATEIIKPWGVISSDWKSWYAEADRTPQKLAAIPEPSRHVALIDLDSLLRSPEGSQVAVSNVIGEPLYVTSRNAAFWDGHVETVPLSYNLYPGYSR